MSANFTKLPPGFDWVVFIQYVLGICPEDKRDLVAEWAKQSATVRAIQIGLWIRVSPEAGQSASRVIAAVEAKIAETSVDRQKELVSTRFSASQGLRPMAHTSSAWKTFGFGAGVSNLKRWATAGVGVAACALVIGVLGVFNWQKADSDKANAYKTYTTRAGQRASLTLRDGSRVTLGPATTLRVSSAKSEKNAIAIDVTGEALFNVNHAAARPFLVTAHGVTTRVLGTEFVVRAYDASLVRVAVRDGRVSVQSRSLTAANAAVVSAGEAASVTSNALPTVMPIDDLATDFAWASGELVLRNVPLGDALIRLSLWYGLEFQVSDPSLLKSRVSAKFPSVFNRIDVEMLARAIGASINYTPTAVIFSVAR